MNINWNGIRMTILATCAALFLLICGLATGETLPGSPDFLPSPKQPVGWRGDGTGKYPGATPPIHWSRICKQTAALKCSFAIPTNQSPANAVPAGAGFFTEWLVAAPISCAHVTNAINQELTLGEASLAPQEGDKIGEVTWKQVQTGDSILDIGKMHWPMTTQQAAYAQSCLYSEKPVKIWFHINCSISSVLWLNGERKHAIANKARDINGSFLLLDLKSGWNRFVFKFTPQKDGRDDFPESCALLCRFWPADEPREYTEKNIAWITTMPGLSEATPVIVGDKIFTTAHPFNLVCLDKKTGKIIWIRQNGTYDAATEEDRKGKPELFVKLDDLAKKREAYYDAFVAGTLATNQTATKEIALEDEMDKLMTEVDDRYKKAKEQGEPNWWEIPTPASDGKNICIFLERGVSACYDLDGKRRWIRYEKLLHQHHGFFGSPVIADGKFFILDGRVTGLDLADGSVKTSFDLSKTKQGMVFASLSRIVFGGKEYVLYPDGTLFRASDGKVFGPANSSGTATPVVFDNNKIFFPWGIYEIKSTTNDDVSVKGINKSVKWPKDSPIVPSFYQGQSTSEASPLVHEGLAYILKCWGSLLVIDLATMEVLYEQVLPIDLLRPEYHRAYMGASIAQAGDYIYLLGSTGVMIVIKPGRKYEEVARNRIHCLAKEGLAMGAYMYQQYYVPHCPEYQDCTMTSTPIFDGNRMYYRGMESLYCVEQNVWALQSADVSRGEAPLTVKFDAGKSHGMPGRKLASYAWDFSDGSTGSPQAGSTLRQGSVQASSGPAAEHTYKAAGTYIAKLTVTDDKGVSDEAQATITVTPVDTVPPEIKSAVVQSETNLVVRFSEPVEQTSAENSANYAISRDVKVISGSLASDASTINLITTPLAEDVKHELTVKNVKDCARNPNMIKAKSRQSFYRFRSPPDEDGYIQSWLRLPSVKLDTTGGKDVFDKEYFPGQKTCAPNEGEKISAGGKELAWKVVRSGNDALLPLYEGYGVVYFCVTYLTCNEDIPGVLLRIGGSHDSSLWLLNGQEVIRTYTNRSLTRDQSVSAPVTLKKGRNVLTAQVIMTSYGTRGICARFVDKDGSPVVDYDVSTGAPAAPPPAK